MATPSLHQQAKNPRIEPVVLDAERPSPELSRFFYELVGGAWNWNDRLAWPLDRWRTWADRPELHLTTCWVDGAPAGYYELEQQGDGVVEIAYFGLVAAVHGQGLGAWLLSRAIDHAWRLEDTSRVWLHSCSLDGPAALPNYQKRGFEIESKRQRLQVTQ